MTHNEMIAVIAAHRDGKILQYRVKNGRDFSPMWTTEIPVWDFDSFDYRISPEPTPKKRVPLGPDDFPPGTVVKRLYTSPVWRNILTVHQYGLVLPPGTLEEGMFEISFDDLCKHSWYYHPFGKFEWLPCWREE